MVVSPMPRSKEFDPEQVLDRAVEVFWRKGYCATSLRELLDAMQISRQSLYDTYGDKRGLFLKALARYRSWLESGFADTAGRPDAGLREVRAIFHLTLERTTSSRMRSCMLANAAIELGLDDPETRQMVRGHLMFVETCFLRALDNACKRNELTCTVDLRSQARHLCNSLHGIGVLARAGYEPAELDAAMQVAVGSLGQIASRRPPVHPHL